MVQHQGKSVYALSPKAEEKRGFVIALASYRAPQCFSSLGGCGSFP